MSSIIYDAHSSMIQLKRQRESRIFTAIFAYETFKTINSRDMGIINLTVLGKFVIYLDIELLIAMLAGTNVHPRRADWFAGFLGRNIG